MAASATKIECVEGVPFLVAENMRQDLRAAVMRTSKALGMRLQPLSETAEGLRITNMVGTLDFGWNRTIHIRPKTGPDKNWVYAVLSLLTGSDDVELADAQATSSSQARADIFEAMGASYAGRLERALRRDGPLLTISRLSETQRALRGRLDVNRWSRTFLQAPTHFPVHHDVLTGDNDFSAALSAAALILAARVRTPKVRARLNRAAADIRPGLPPRLYVEGIQGRELPLQWAIYRPAWSIAQAVLLRKSLLGPTASQAGLSLAIEPWPLLERQLEISLASLVRKQAALGRDLEWRRQDYRRLLRPLDPNHSVHSVKPDAVLLEAGVPIATFEAKYRDINPAEGPHRDEIYQALAAARAIGSPLSVLVYPNALTGRSWRVEGGDGSPVRVAAVGLDMYSYRRGAEEISGQLLLDLIEDGAAP